MADQEIIQTMKRKIQDGALSARDLPAYLGIFCELGGEVEDMQDEVEGWDRKIQLAFTGFGDYWIQIEDGVFTLGEGQIEAPGLKLEMSAEQAVLIFSEKLDTEEAYLSNALKVDGDLMDAVRLNSLIEIVADEIES